MKDIRHAVMVSLLSAAFVSCALTPHLTPPPTIAPNESIPREGDVHASHPPRTWSGSRYRGTASFYASMLDGHPTASGELFDVHQRTAAHLTFPFGTLLEVRRLDNQRTVVVRVNDRGPYVGGRLLDLSPAAADALEMKRTGVAEVEITVLRAE